ncbi:hypothetical protein K431DRAFT_229461 [Polychaeton citri CBS 116435]|uniref:Pre-mRNA polyadenylation factor Fip1 domain-containing protein n=1 Tax=Polychaeton citri CBS 116435 TaxID=1314669 RepID=A0A9P4UN67_9PEZI|nr:hypothetical protein K431DRAFT_229461 [Polychaeton citri CBS 116435]
MEEDEDDFYGGATATTTDADQSLTHQQPPADHNGDNQQDEDDDEEDDEDDDSDVDIVLDRPDGAADSPPPTKRPRGPEATRSESTVPQAGRTGTPTLRAESSQQQQRSGSIQPPTSMKGVLQYNGKQGKDYPQVVKQNGVDVNAIPDWPGVLKPITEVDIDADLAENSKLWRLPGTDQTDFFNYGFDEYSWTQYCLKQQTMAGTIAQGREDDARMKAMFGGGPPAPSTGPPSGPMGGMPPGMPTEQDMAMMAQMFGMTPDQMMQQMMNGGPMPGGPMGGQQDGRGGGGFGGSPLPQGPSGFQPPTGPSGGGGSVDMSGYSQQQMAIMQQEQQGGGYGGRGRGRGRRGHY